MLTAEAEKKVREIAKAAAEKAVLDSRSVAGKQTNFLNVSELEATIRHLDDSVRNVVRFQENLTNRVVDLQHEVEELQKEVDILKSDVSSVLK